MYVGSVEEMMCVVCVDVTEGIVDVTGGGGHNGDGCVLASTLCKYNLRKGNLFVLSWARVRRVMQGSISSGLLMCGGGTRSILLLPRVARCLETIDVCIWRMFVLCLLWCLCWGLWECLLGRGRC